MTRRRFLLAGLLLFALVAPAARGRTSAAASPVTPPLPDVVRTMLPNGMTVLTLENHSVPSITLYLYFKVGSRNEHRGITGISHLFEHMMFNGSEKFPPKSFDQTIEAGGGYSNGSTWWDYTNYWEEFSPAALDRVLELEADRMRALRIDEQNLEQERGIVLNERLLRVDNSVDGTLFERLWAEAFLASPYRWPVVGWAEDLKTGIRLEDAKRYFRTYYAPNNCVLVLVGDFATRPTLEKIRRLWKDVPAAEPPRPVSDPEPPQLGEKRVVIHKEAQSPMLGIGFKAPGFAGARAADLPAFTVLGTILGEGRSSPLYRKLVDETQLCTNVSVFVPSFAMTSLATFIFELAPGKDPAAVEKELDAILAKVQQGVDEKDLARARNQIEADFLRGLVGNEGRGSNLGYYEALRGDWKEMYRLLDAYRKTTAAEVRRVAKTYLVPQNRTVAILLPEKLPAVVDFKEGAPEEAEPKRESR
jgi:predicted Zn-dependent peptidase